mgnify:CR=1 FL=1
MKIEFQNGKFVAIDGSGRIVASSASKYYLKQKIAGLQTSFVAPVESKFSINDRFSFVEKLVTMVASKTSPSAVITGEGGLGKSFTVIEALKRAGLRDVSEIDPGSVVSSSRTYRVIKGFSTAKGLFRVLHENKNGIIVFDDCDSILKDPDALNLLKGALDSFDKRLITWNTSVSGDGLPRVFEFTGGVIFISNLPQEKIDQALKTRSMNVDLTMTTDQKIERMAFIAQRPEFLPGVAVAIKSRAIALIKKHSSTARETSLRTLIKTSKILASSNDEQLATYMLTEA